MAPLSLRATEFTSSNFKLLDPVLRSGGFSSSNSFRLQGSLGQLGIGFSESGSFEVKGGSLYFAAPAAATPSPTPTPSSSAGGGGPILEIFKKIIGLITPCSHSDLNCDGLVNIYDAGILFYWWNKPLVQPNFASALASILGLGRPSPDRNGDKEVDIFDLSILLSDWTG